MADPLSIASGAAGIISLGLTIAQGLFQIADSIGSAGQEVRIYAEDINAFSKLLKRVKIELDSSTDVSVDIQSLVNDVVDICDRVLKPLDGLQNTLKPLLDHFRSSPSKFRQLKLRLQWVFRTKDKLLFYRHTLKEQHRILDTILEIMILQTSRDRHSQNIYIMQLPLKNSMAAVELSHRASQQLNFKIYFEESLPGVPLEGRGFDAGDSHDGASEDHLALVRPTSNDSGEDLSEQAILTVDGWIVRDLNSESPESAQEIWHDICALQRKVLRLASQTLQSEVKFEMTISIPNPKDYTVGWICAGKTIYVAALGCLDAEHEGAEYISANDPTIYTLGKVGKHNVVITHLSEDDIGISSAAIIATQMRRSFPNVTTGLMVGIGGGAPSDSHDIRLGDIVVSTPRNGMGGVFQYDIGRTMQDQGFQPTGFLNQPPTALLAAVNTLNALYERKGHGLEEAIQRILQGNPKLRMKYCRPDPRNDILFQPNYVHHSNVPECSACDQSALVKRCVRSPDEGTSAIHFGLIASANQIMKDAVVRDRLAAEKDVLCFDTAAAGVMNHFPCLVICGICNYSDTHSYKQWNGYAAMAAAAYTKELLYQIPPRS